MSRLRFAAAIEWHKAGVISSPNAPSVQLTQGLVEELLRARELIRAITAPADPTRGVTDRWMSDAMRFTFDTQDLEQFRNG